MTQRVSIGKVDVQLTASVEATRATTEQESPQAPDLPEPGTPFRILLLGDFSAHSPRGVPSRENQKPLHVDRDTFDVIIKRLRPELHLEVPTGEPVRAPIRFASLDDFHPDRLFERLDVFHALRDLRKRLHDPATFDAAATEVRAWTGTPAAANPRPSRPADQEGEPSEAQQVVRDLLENVGQRAPGALAPPADDWAQFLRRIVSPHLVPGENPQRPELVVAVDRATSALMRDILHHPDFQALEAAWRSVDFLVRRLETRSDLQLHLLDLPRASLAAALEPASDLRSSWLYRSLMEGAPDTPGGVRWAVLLGNFTFGASPEDVGVLSRMARIAQAAEAPFLAAASPRLLGCDSAQAMRDVDGWRPFEPEEAKRWNQLRASPEAAYLGLTLPRLLMRLPYGRDGEPLETFDFEELPDGTVHDHYLWGNPAFACVCLLGEAFAEHGWNLRSGEVQELDSLPLYIYEHDGERRIKPPAEVLLTLEAAEMILDRGFMPLLSFRDRDIARLGRFQSLREPLTALAGRWRG